MPRARFILNSPEAEWLEADGLGGFASGTVSGIRTRRYHALLLSATTPPTGRVVLVNGVEAWLEDAGEKVALTQQLYAPDVLDPPAGLCLTAFTHDPWPRWTIGLPDGGTIVHEIFLARDSGETVLRWDVAGAARPWRLRVRPLLSGRDYHALHRENQVFAFHAQSAAGNVTWRPYAHLPAISALSNGFYAVAPEWYRNFLYTQERDRGLDAIEDLAAPGVFTFDDLASGAAVMILRAGDGLSVRAGPHAGMLAAYERQRRAAAPGLAVAARSYLVDRGAGLTVLAGFPWFTDWGRDSFIALRGLAIATGWLAEAEAVLLEWAGTVDQGMLPNRFPDDGGTPEFNAVDASLWFIIAVHEFLEAAHSHEFEAAHSHELVQKRLGDAVMAIVEGYAAGTRFGIVADVDGLLRAGVPGVQLTWMDAKCGDWVVTPRMGKPVEVQALWINALRIARRWSDRWVSLEASATAAFAQRFASPAGGLYDVVDDGHVAGAVDASLRPNQIFAVGGLPFAVLDGPIARGVVDVVERHLLTPMGLRTLAPTEPAYVGRYQGTPAERDGAYHQGTAWPWLLGAFVQAWLRVRGDTGEARREAADRFLPPLLAHLETAGLGHVSEVADGDAPHEPGGCPFQAWSLGELIRIQRMVQIS